MPKTLLEVFSEGGDMDNLDRAIWRVVTQVMSEPPKNNDCKALMPRIKALVEREIAGALAKAKSEELERVALRNAGITTIN